MEVGFVAVVGNKMLWVNKISYFWYTTFPGL